jgi:hypothetical protein
MVNSEIVNLIEKLLDLQWCIHVPAQVKVDELNNAALNTQRCVDSQWR